MACEGIVAGVVCGNRHDGTGSVAREHVFCYVDGTFVAGDGIDAVCAGEHTRYGVVNHTLAFGAALHIGQVFVHLFLLFGGGQFGHQLALGSQNKEGNAEHGVGTGGEDGEVHIAVGHLYLHLGTLAASNPVLLCLLDAVAPLNGLQAVQQTLCVCAHTQTPLAHLLLLHGISAALAHTVNYLVVGQHGSQLGAPVHHCFAQEGYAVVHQGLALLLFVHCLPLLGAEGQFLSAGGGQSLRTLLLKVGNELFNGLSLSGCGAEV